MGRRQRPALRQTGDEFDRTRPFEGLRIGTGIHLEPKTAALLRVLQRGGASVVSTGNLNSTQQETVDYLRANGIDVKGGPTADPAVHDADLRAVLAAQPDLLLDNGGDLFTRYLEAPWDGLRGGTEETTSGRDRLLPLRDRLRLPLLVINDSPIKQFGENTHAVGAGTVESFIRITNRITNGRRVTVFGYGSVGRGVAACFRAYNSIVSVVESQPVLRLRALCVEHEYDRGGALQYLAAWDVRRARLFGRCEPATGIEPFGRLVAQVMSQPPFATAERVCLGRRQRFLAQRAGVGRADRDGVAEPPSHPPAHPCQLAQPDRDLLQRHPAQGAQPERLRRSPRC